MRKSKITKLFDWDAYERAQKNLTQSPQEKTAVKKAAEQDKALRAFESSVTKDIKIGLKALHEAVNKGESARVSYFLHLDYFSKSEAGGGSLLILGSHPNIRKAFINAGKTAEKVNLSFGEVELDSNNILRFIPAKNGMKIKPKPLVEALKQAPISKSNPGFWSKRKVNNVIIGVAEEAQQELTGDSKLLEESVTYTEGGINSEIYDAFMSFVNRDYTNSNGTQNSEYYAQTLKQVDDWIKRLHVEFKTKGDKNLKAVYQKMGKKMLVFKKKVQQELDGSRSQQINEDSALSSFTQVFDRTIKEYHSSDDAYQESILKSKLERILLELKQKASGGEDQEAGELLQVLANKLTKLSSSASPASPASPIVETQIENLLGVLTNLVADYESFRESTV